MNNSTAWVSFELMESFIADVFQTVGVPKEDAKICADVLITADKRGIDSHGVGRLKPIYYDRIKSGVQNPITRLDILREGPTTAVLDGNHGMGHVIAKRAMEIAIEKAKKLGLGMAGA